MKKVLYTSVRSPTRPKGISESGDNEAVATLIQKISSEISQKPEKAAKILVDWINGKKP